MKTTAHACLITALAFSIQNATATTTGSPPNCTKQKCVVSVSVGGNSCGAGISVTPDPLIVSTADGGPVTITWKVTGGWVFDSKGILVVPSGGDIKVGNFDPAKKDTFTAVNAAKTKASYKYDINLVKGDAKCNLDPTIVNH